MKVKIQNYNDVTVVELQGELDADVAELSLA
jgi:anti-anti-sigma regulatory factor